MRPWFGLGPNDGRKFQAAAEKLCAEQLSALLCGSSDQAISVTQGFVGFDLTSNVLIQPNNALVGQMIEAGNRGQDVRGRAARSQSRQDGIKRFLIAHVTRRPAADRHGHYGAELNERR